MKRKVIQIANSTQLVSLPRKWAQRYNIKKGDEIDVEEKGNKLLISTQGTQDMGDTEVDISGMDRDSLMFLIRALYKNGYDKIKLIFNNPHIFHIRLNKKVKAIDVITEEVSRLTGVDIFSQKENYCIIRSVTEDSPKVFDNMLRRIFLLTLETMNDFVVGFRDNNKAAIESIQQKHDNITKFIVYSQRILNKVGYNNLQKTDILYHILEVIDEIVDLIKFNARDLHKFNIKASKESFKINKKVVESFDISYNLFYKFNIDDVFKINNNRYETLELLDKYSKNLSNKELMLLIRMEQILEKIINLTTSTMSLHH